jgi:hypothetical protein
MISTRNRCRRDKFASPVAGHHAKLAWPAADGSPCRGRADRRDDDQDLPEGRVKVSKAEKKRIDIAGDQFHPEWNYTIRPRQQSKS